MSPPKGEMIQSDTEIISFIWRASYSNEIRKSGTEIIFSRVTVITECRMAGTLGLAFDKLLSRLFWSVPNPAKPPLPDTMQGLS